MLFQAVLLLLIIWYIVFYIKRRRLYQLAAQFDGPPPLPIIGNALKCIMPYTEMPDTILKTATYYNSPTRFWFGPYLVIYIWNPEDIKIILNNPHALAKSPFMYKFSESVVGRGLINIPVDEWKRHRRLISPNFNQLNLESFFGIISRHSHALVGILKCEVGNHLFDVEHYISKCILQFILETLLGFNSDDSNTCNYDKLSELLKEMQIGIISRMSNILYFPEFIFKLSSTGKTFIETRRKYMEIINSIIGKWKHDLKNQHAKNVDYDDNSASSKPKSFVEHLLLTDENVGKFTADELRGEVNTFIAAGLDTTTTMFSMFLLMLGMHPEVQERVYQEIAHLLDNDKQLRYEDLNNFQYLDNVIKETLRMFPVLAGLGRYVDQDIKLEKHTIPAGANVIIGTLNLHRDPHIWPNPTKFDPDRFLPDEEAKRHPYSWIPFSAGPRNCIGFRFALNALKILAVDIVQNYKIETDYKNVEDIRLSMFVVLKSTNGYNISISAR